MEAELPAAVVDSLESWSRVLSGARPENVPDLMHSAATDLFRTRKIGRSMWPDADGVVNQAIVDTLAEWAEAAEIDPDEAQRIFVEAQRDGSTKRLNGNVAVDNEPPLARRLDELGAARAPEEPEPIAPASLMTPAEWPNEAPPPVDWLVAGRIPRGEVTLFTGDGGTGKTDAGVQLATSVARKAPDWFGHEIVPGPVVFVSAEESEREIQRRLYRLGKRDGYGNGDLGNLQQWFPDNGGDCVMAVSDRSGIMRPTPLFRSIEAAIAIVAPVLVVVDNVAATFAGNQNDRVAARTYVNLWRTIARGPSLPAVLLLDHPSLSGLNSGTGRGGNMDWWNAVRSVLLLRIPDDKAEADLGIRLLETGKSNYAKRGNPLRLVWTDGGLATERQPSSSLHRLAKDAECDEAFLRLLDERNGQGRHVGDKPSAIYAPAIFAGMDGNGAFTVQAFARAMERLFAAGKITLQQSGPPSKRRSRIERAMAAAIRVAAE